LNERQEKLDELKKLTSATHELGLEISGKADGRRILNIIETILDHSGLHAEIVDRDLRLVYLSPCAIELTRFARGNIPLMGKKCYCECHGRNLPCSNCIAKEAFDTGEPVTATMEFAYGKARMTAIPIFDNGISAVIIFAHEMPKG